MDVKSHENLAVKKQKKGWHKLPQCPLPRG
jgi:hypothetical protein